MSSVYSQLIANNLGLRERQVDNTITLLEEGSTVPFISRYRKEVTGSLDEVQVADIREHLGRFKEVDKRREAIISSIEEQGKLTPELRKRLEATWNMTELEDIYLPYKPKRKTRASIAREKGLEPLAEIIMKQLERDVETRAEAFLTDDVPDVAEALQGARDIIAEWVNENESARAGIRRLFSREAVIYSKVAKGKETEGIQYKDYFQFEEQLKNCPSHRLLAMRRGEEEGFLKISISPQEDNAIDILERLFVKGRNEASHQVAIASKDSYKRLLEPSIETEFSSLAKEKADEEAIKVFAENLRQLLLASPLGPKRVLALDPGFRTGCKVVCLDAQGNLLHNTTIYPHPPQEDKMGAAAAINLIIKDFKIEAIAVGNGTAGRETELFMRSLPSSAGLPVFLVSESGASIYSASAVAREEFPQYDVTVRGAISIGRRLMDPLAELVKIDPKSIGVGQYQHDVEQKKLRESLDTVVEHCVNKVGVNLNTASKHLLTYISGLGPQLAQNIVDYRKENGAFTSRQALKKVPRLGGKAFEQCAGFLRIPDAKHPLDNTAVHPERYTLVEKMATDLECKVTDLIKDAELRKRISLQKYVDNEVGLPTLQDIMNELAKPGRDPRGPLEEFTFAPGIHKIEDVSEGMVVPGIVTNITNFGVFVDIGVKQDGMVHISQLSHQFVRDPNTVVKLQQAVTVKVTEVDLVRKRIALTMKL